MRIKDKEAFKAALRELVEKHIREFPFYFTFNIVVNLLVIAGFVILASVLISSRFMLLEPVVTGTLFLYTIAYFTVGNFLKDINILHALRADHWGLDIKNYEWDHLAHFVIDLPQPQAEVEKLEQSLSFGKLVKLLELFDIIIFEGGICDLDRVSRRKIERRMEGKGVYAE